MKFSGTLMMAILNGLLASVDAQSSVVVFDVGLTPAGTHCNDNKHYQEVAITHSTTTTCQPFPSKGNTFDYQAAGEISNPGSLFVCVNAACTEGCSQMTTDGSCMRVTTTGVPSDGTLYFQYVPPTN